MAQIEARHTPTPWHLAKAGQAFKTDQCSVATFEVVSEASASWIAEVLHTKGGEGRANAELILRAVNCHDELLAACVTALAHLSGKATKFSERERTPVMSILREAIEKATKGAG